jgi:hypothetical protein
LTIAVPPPIIRGRVVNEPVLLLAPLRWYVGGAWFRLRLRMAGARALDGDRAQAVFVWSDLVSCVPLIALALVHTPAPLAGGGAVLAHPAAGAALEHRHPGRRAWTAFSLSPWRAALLSVVLPLVYYGFIFGRAMGWFSGR